MKKGIIYTLSAIALFSMFSCGEKPSGTESTDVAAAETAETVVHPVKVMPIEKTVIKRTINTTASLVAEEETYLAPSIPGKIRTIDVEVDDRVRKGQVLVEMDKSQLLQAKLQYENLKKDLARMDTLLKFGSVTQQSYDQMRTQLEVTESTLENLQENTALKAPYNGIVTGKYYNDREIYAGAPNTQAGKAAIVSLVKMDVLKVFINLSERYLPLVKEGQTATVKTEVYGGETFTATVYKIHPTINPATRTFTVELSMSNADYRLRPGMYSAVALELGDREALLVPSLAVIKQTGTNTRYIFMHENGKAVRKTVQLGERIDDKLELIPNGIKGGEELIYAGHLNLMDGDAVNVISE
ncbi:MAG: efflux RND transporter periplasmic adaptor subunit [Bacteroidales bacterium]|nr:efflux RND transporter periplasmic adaptor subunit [Bacteroidales bacterium]MDT8431851.1 efflux RND transporter periplasmic adaptor subunit [Bacteroidales bacterium]